MEINKAFLGNEGITATSANHLANLAKEETRDAEAYLENVTFVDTHMGLLSSVERTPFTKGYSEIDLTQINLIGKLHSFCAFIREAIKHKESLKNFYTSYSFAQYQKDNNITLPKIYEMDEWTEENVINQWDTKKRAHYFYLEAMAAAYGKYIHPDGSISQARRDYYNKLNNPARKEGTGRDTVIYVYEPAISKEQLDKSFATAQNTHRSFESQLNQLKAEIKATVDAHNLEEEQKRNESQKISDAASHEEFGKYQIFVKTKLKEIQALKIVIPDALKATYDHLNSLGK